MLKEFLYAMEGQRLQGNPTPLLAEVCDNFVDRWRTKLDPKLLRQSKAESKLNSTLTARSSRHEDVVQSTKVRLRDRTPTEQRDPSSEEPTTPIDKEARSNSIYDRLHMEAVKKLEYKTMYEELKILNELKDCTFKPSVSFKDAQAQSNKEEFFSNLA